MTENSQWSTGGLFQDKYRRKPSRSPLIVAIVALGGLGAAYVYRDTLSAIFRPQRQAGLDGIQIRSKDDPPVITQQPVLHDPSGEAAHTGKPVRSVIVPGVGIPELHVGMPVEEVFAKLGKPDSYDRTSTLIDSKFYRGPRSYEPEGCNVYMRRGLMFTAKDGQVTRIFFRFRVKTFASFDGATDKGAGMWSTVHDVMRAYGEPDAVDTRSTVRLIENFQSKKPNAQDEDLFDYELAYLKLGVSFQFRNGELQWISVPPPNW